MRADKLLEGRRSNGTFEEVESAIDAAFDEADGYLKGSEDMLHMMKQDSPDLARKQEQMVHDLKALQGHLGDAKNLAYRLRSKYERDLDLDG